MRRRMNRQLALLLPVVALVGCADPYLPYVGIGESEEPFSSAQATLLDFEFNGQITTESSWGLKQQIESQILYTIGQLNGNKSVGRIDKMVLTDVRSEVLASGLTKVTYHAKLPVAWGSKTNLPTAYEFLLPLRADYTGLDAFTDEYKATCVDFGAHDVDSGSMWYYYRPKKTGCVLGADDIARIPAVVTVSPENTNNKYPEYHMVWKDQTLDVVAIFGKYEDGATSSSDAGIAAYNKFVSSLRTTLGATGLTTVPATVPSAPGVAMPDVMFKKVYTDGRRVNVTALLVDNVRTAPASFDTRYNALSLTADVIFYNGHAGLGSNVRALANKGQFAPGKYQIFFMNGCDTFAYVDGALAQKKASINPDDPNGTKYLDIMTNAMPSFFSSMPAASMALIKGLLVPTTPKKYQEIFKNIDAAEVVVVTGEEDNVYVPGYDPNANNPVAWSGMEVAGSVTQNQEARHQTPLLAAGRYVFTLAHDPMAPAAGDADLYVKMGSAPTTSTYDCRPYDGGSNETCTVSLTTPAIVHVMVRGYDAGANGYVLTGKPE